jgi:hypothetical protein
VLKDNIVGAAFDSMVNIKMAMVIMCFILGTVADIAPLIKANVSTRCKNDMTLIVALLNNNNNKCMIDFSEEITQCIRLWLLNISRMEKKKCSLPLQTMPGLRKEDSDMACNTTLLLAMCLQEK